MLKPTSKMKQFGFTGIMVFAFLMMGISPGIAVDKFNKSKTGVAIKLTKLFWRSWCACW